ncbi:SRPBCC family protein [Leptolyngbya sp. FACHB-261]|uniref:SRPBCC family protein n=1 Tax=Leptolyngbya sp. FACHB-261 TaxID=2692806 RepID=UPI001683207E|nr:SRPBCC family protein [Leptolyngbya sp. FACHB-261]MBD2101935.1 SRPBCC family protein [Leptolyngbya sp. FACHB-261]
MIQARVFLGLLLSGSCLLVGMVEPAFAQSSLFNGPVDALPLQERVTLRQGRPIITGENGSYVARVLVNTTPAQAWSVLTDYSRYSSFLPNIASSQVLSSKGNERVVEQVDRRRVALFTITSRIRISIVETPQSSYRFQLVEGDLQNLQGSWTIQPVSAYPGGPATQVLITHQIQAEPKSGTPRNIFYNLFQSQLRANLDAISQEIRRRGSV